MDSDAATVAVVGEGPSPSLREALGGTTVVDRSAADPVDAVVLAEPTSLPALAAEPPEAPVVAVGAGHAVAAVEPADLRDAIDAVAAGTAPTVTHPVLSVAVDGEPLARAVRDVVAVTAEPARISEFTVRDDGVAVTNCRADGIVLATPAGSHGYAAAADGPLLAPETGIAVVSVAPFATDRSRWVRPPTALTVSVDRDEGAVSLVVDGEPLDRLGEGDRIEVGLADRFSVATPTGHRPPGGDRSVAGGLERH